MRKALKITAAVFGVLLFVGLIAGYFYGRSQLKTLPGIVQKTLKEQNINLTFKDVEIPAAGLKVILKDLSVTGAKLPYFVKAENAAISVSLSFGWPPLKLSFTAVKPVVEKNESYVAETKAAPPSDMSGLKYASLALAFVQFQAGVVDANLPEFGVGGLTTYVTLWKLGLSAQGVDRAYVKHDVEVKSLKQAPWLGTVRTTGKSVYDKQQVEITDGTLEVGPFNITMAGTYDIKSQKWSSKLNIPETNLKSASGIVSAHASEWINSIAGYIALNVSAEGVGSNPDSVSASGKVKAKDLAINLKHPMAKGELVAQLDADFSKTQKIAVNSNLAVDLSAVELNQNDQFVKPKGVPMLMKAKIDGKEDFLKITQGIFKIHNLEASLDGEVNVGKEPYGKLHGKIAPTPFTGWEKFFPKVAGVKTQGTLEGDFSYDGPFKEWQNAFIQANLKASQIKFPILKAWLPNKDANVTGLVSLDSDSKVAISKGAIQTLNTQTKMDMQQNEIVYGEMFHKKAGVPLNAEFVIQSTGKKAEIKKGDFQLTSMKVSAKGSIDNLTNPVANISFSSNSLPITEMMTLSPASKMKTITNLGGTLQLKGVVQGPLTQKKQLPQVKGELALNHVKLNYEMESKKIINVTDITGPVLFTMNSVSLKKMKFALPKTDGVLDLDVVGFDKPKVTFNLQGNRLTLSDLFDPPAKGQGGAALAMVPVAKTTPGGKGGAAQKEDFRKNPYIKNLTMNGSATIRNADLGYAKADLITGKMSFDNLLLKVDPATMKTYGGTLTSHMEWNGRPEVPTTKLSMNVNAVDANQFLSGWSSSYGDIVFGKLNSDFNFQMSGMTPEEIKKSTKGGGNFALNDGEIKTLKLSQKPLEALKAVPAFSGSIQKTAWEEKLQKIAGAFSVSDGKILLSNMILQSGPFDAETSQVSLDFDQNISAKLAWIPKESLISGATLDMLKDDKGRPSIPLSISGNIRSPKVTLDGDVVQDRLKQYAMRKLEAEKNRIVEEAKQKAQHELENQLKSGLQGLFK